MWGLLADSVEDGVALEPGHSCGADYEGGVRLCFTAAPPEDVARASAALARRLSA
jgi:DNA-binding transcriptional MocR family regulator